MKAKRILAIILAIILSISLINLLFPLKDNSFNRLIDAYCKIGLDITILNLNICRDIVLNESYSTIFINASGCKYFTIQGKILNINGGKVIDIFLDNWSNISIYLNRRGKYRVCLEKAYIFYGRKKPKVTIFVSKINGLNIHLNLSKYPRLKEYYQILHRLIYKNIDIASIDLLGFSWHGKPIYGISIGAGDKPIVVIVAHHHAREIITAYFSLYLLWRLLLERPDVINEYRIIVIPMLNPDGYEMVFSNPWLRKNLHPIDDDGDGLLDEDGPEDIDGDGYISEYRNSSGIFYEGIDNDGDGKVNEDWPGGVDLNRNYPVKWSQGVCSKSSIIYRGENPFSEPETLAIKYFIEKYRNKIMFLLTYHSGANLILYPYSYTNMSPPDLVFFKNISGIYCRIVKTSTIQSSKLYYSYGEITDWLYDYYGIPAITIEMYGKAYDCKWRVKHTFRKNGTTIFKHIFEFFNPIDDEIKVVLEKHYNALIYMLKYLKYSYNQYYRRSSPEFLWKTINREIEP